MSGSDAPRPRRLQRLTGAIAAHNWFSVAIEVAIVTVGVLLAFQIEQWGQRRGEAEQERQFLERLYVEYGRGIDELERVNRNHDKVMDDYRRAFAARGDPALLARFARMPDMGCALGYLRTTPLNDTLMAELVDGGRLSLISDPVLRGHLRDLTTEQASLKDRAAGSTEITNQQAPIINPYYRYELLPDGRSVCTTMFPEMLADPRAATAAIRDYRMHENTRRGRRELKARIERVQAELACALEKPECRR